MSGKRAGKKRSVEDARNPGGLSVDASRSYFSVKHVKTRLSKDERDRIRPMTILSNEISYQLTLMLPASFLRARKPYLHVCITSCQFVV